VNTVTDRLKRAGSLEKNPRLSQWLRFEGDGSVSVFSGKVEIGQGILTALAQIAAEELGVAAERIRMVAADTSLSPRGRHLGKSVDPGFRCRAQARVRARALAAARARGRAPGRRSGELEAEDGTVRAGGANHDFLAGADAALFDRTSKSRSRRKRRGNTGS